MSQNSVNRESFDLENDKKKLLDAILKRQEDRRAKKQALSLDLQKIIKEGANSNDAEFKQLASLLAYETTEAYYSLRAAKFAEKGRTEVEDLQSELYLLISENLHKYNGENSLFTFFDPLVNRAFIKAREKGRGVASTRYFRDLGPYITKAMEEMKQMGLEEPTPTDLSDFIRVRRGKNISEATIEQWLLAHKTDKSLDEIGDVFKDNNINNNPEDSLLRKEDNDEFYSAIAKTSPQSQRVLLAEVDYINRRGLIPTATDLFPTLLEEGVVKRLQDAELLMTSAHNELKTVIIGGKKKLKRLPLNHFKTKENFPRLFEEEDANILSALEDSPDSLFDDI